MLCKEILPPPRLLPGLKHCFYVTRTGPSGLRVNKSACATGLLQRPTRAGIRYLFQNCLRRFSRKEMTGGNEPASHVGSGAVEREPGLLVHAVGHRCKKKEERPSTCRFSRMFAGWEKITLNHLQGPAATPA